MNIILYKGYSKKLNKMLYGFPYIENNIKNFIVKDKEFYEVDKLYQYIGRVDKEGNPIFENDKVKLIFYDEIVEGYIEYNEYLNTFKCVDEEGYSYDLDNALYIILINE